MFKLGNDFSKYFFLTNFQTLLLDITVLKIFTRKSDYKTRIKTKSSKVLKSFNVNIQYLARKFKGLFLKI